MEIIEFLRDRLNETEREIEHVAGTTVYRKMMKIISNQYRLLDWAEVFPVLDTDEPKFEQFDSALGGVHLHVSQRFRWMTAQEFVRVFGKDPAIPLLKEMALPYADHPDYKKEWLY